MDVGIGTDMGISSIEEYERIQPNAMVDGMLFNIPNRHCQWRVETMYTKEPDTIEWIRSMPAGSVFYDVGANIGLYTVLAAKQGLKTFAFEPEGQNFAVLIRNLAMNNLTNAVAFPFSITDTQSISTLRLQSLQVGGSCHSYGSDLNYKREAKTWAYAQGSCGFSLDELVLQARMPQPDYIKVDVDGFEDKVLAGGVEVLKNVRSVLVEMDSANADHMGWKARLEESGFRTDEAQISKARRSEGPFTGIGNIIFYRDSHDASEQATDNAEATGVQTRVRELDHQAGQGE